MADYGEAISMPRPKMEKPHLQSIMLKKADNGGVIAEHRMSTFSGKEPVHAFGENEGHMLAAHLTKHLGIKMPTGALTEEEE